MTAPLLPGLTSWIAWDPTGEADRARWFRSIQQAFDEDPDEIFSWHRHGERVMTLWLGRPWKHPIVPELLANRRPTPRPRRLSKPR